MKNNWNCDACGAPMTIYALNCNGEIDIDPPYFCNNCEKRIEDQMARLIEASIERTNYSPSYERREDPFEY